MSSSTTAAPNVTFTATECPECGHHSIVPLSSGVYHCLHCDFHKDVSDASDKKGEDSDSVGGGLLSILAFVLLLAMFI